MVQLEWDKIDERRFETGIDRGVLYLEDGRGVSWSGFTSVDENVAETTSPFFLDGVKYLDVPTISDYEATLKAFTYPDEFLEYEGMLSLGGGLYADDQPPKQFSLSYRTLVGDGLRGIEFGYRTHLVWNLIASIDAKSFTTNTNIQNLSDFTWKVSSLPETIPGYRPTAHAYIDSTKIDPFLLADLEAILYGTDEVEARLPSLSELNDFLADWTLFVVTDNGDGTFTIEGPDELMDVDEDGLFEIREINATHITPNAYTIPTTEP